MAILNPFEIIDSRLQNIEDSLQQLIKKPDPKPPTEEKYLTTDQVCELWSISRVSLWNWDKKGITNPVSIGNLKRYRLSDIENLGKSMEGGGI